MVIILRRGTDLPQDRYSLLPNAWVRDARLTYRARGLLAALNAHRDGWELTEQALADNAPDGLASVRGAVKELLELGYLRRERLFDERRRIAGFEWTLMDPFAVPQPGDSAVDNLGTTAP